MQILSTILDLIVGFLGFALVLRSWLQFCRVDPYIPISQTLIRLTAPMVNPVSRVIPTIKNINFAALLIAVLLVVLKFMLYGNHLLISTLIGVLSIVKTFGQILFFATLIRALMSWISQGNHPLDYIIGQITEPVLGFIRTLLPKTGMLDFSVMVIGIVLILLNNLFYSLFGTLWLLA